MTYKTQEGQTLKQYEDPEAAGYFGWVEDAEGNTVGFLRAEGDDELVLPNTVDDSEGGDKGDAGDSESDTPAKVQAAQRKAAQSRGKGAKRVKTVPEKVRPGGRPSLQQLNEQRLRNDALVKKQRGDPRKHPFKNIAEGQAYSAKVAKACDARMREAAAAVKKITAEATAQAEKIVEQATAQADAIRKAAVDAAG